MKKDRNELMEEVAAATTILRRTNNFTRDDEMEAFMGIFYPQLAKDRKYMRDLKSAMINPDERL